MTATMFMKLRRDLYVACVRDDADEPRRRVYVEQRAPWWFVVDGPVEVKMPNVVRAKEYVARSFQIVECPKR